MGVSNLTIVSDKSKLAKPKERCNYSHDLRVGHSVRALTFGVGEAGSSQLRNHKKLFW